jgi:hypothetical protein
MVNPVRGFISNDRLFTEQDVTKHGIRVIPAEGESLEELVERVFAALWGDVFTVDIAGDVVTVDRRSAEDFFKRNNFEGILPEGMPLAEKVMRLVQEFSKRRSHLPHGMLPQKSVTDSGQIVGRQQQFHSLVESLTSNRFNISWLKEQLELQEGKYIRVDRDQFFKKMIEENSSQLPFLEASGAPEIRTLMLMLIEAIKKANEQKA